jgi:hypothetical protein
MTNPEDWTLMSSITDPTNISPSPSIKLTPQARRNAVFDQLTGVGKDQMDTLMVSVICSITTLYATNLTRDPLSAA